MTLNDLYEQIGEHLEQFPESGSKMVIFDETAMMYSDLTVEECDFELFDSETGEGQLLGEEGDYVRLY